MFDVPRSGLAVNRQSSIVNRQSQHGIALVITLILLSVITFMAVTFLVISRREKGSVTTTTDTATARYAADTALAAAEAQIIANMFVSGNNGATNPYNFGLLVSTNFINANGFAPGYNNVNYDYDAAGNPLTFDQLRANLTNLLYSPRAPVFVGNEFRFYLDLNRNGMFDTNGLVPNVNSQGQTNGTPIFQVGDPEWIGILQRPDQPHGPDNPFVARYAFYALPVGNTLDLNAIHNQALNTTLSFSDGYFRNQGVGSWEINLAAMLRDLNTNKWDTYNYQRPNGFQNSGTAFDDARQLLSYRYNFNYNSLASADGLYFYGGLYQFDNIDEYGDGPLQTTTANINESVSGNQDFTANLWAGADNTNHFYAPGDLFDPARTFAFATNLANPGTNTYGGNTVPTYDRYTFYRLLAQLGTDSAPETGKMNLNYDNVDAGSNGVLIATGTASATNFVAWTPLGFFTNAADRMLRMYSAEWFKSGPSNYLATYYGITYPYRITVDQFGRVNGLTNAPFFGVTNTLPSFGIGNIPVLQNNRFVYSPAVQRVLQLAANLYDATTNRTPTLGKDYPSVFRPTFVRTNENGFNNVYVNGFQQVVSVANNSDAQLNFPVEINNLLLGNSTANYPNGVNVFGVPWIIGAKKGFPNFNEFSMESIVQVTRKLQLTRTTNGVSQGGSGLSAMLTGTNQMYIFGITNYLGIECWNSYTSNYISPNLQISVEDRVSTALTNGLNSFPVSYSLSVATNFTTWPGTGGWVGGSPSAKSSFIVPLQTNLAILANSVYRFDGHFVPVDSAPPPNFEVTIPNITGLPHFGLQTTNRLRVIILDGNQVIDYVQFAGPDSSRDLNAELADPNSSGAPDYYLWSTNLFSNGLVPYGVVNQIAISSRQGTLNSQDGGQWNSPPDFPSNIPATIGKDGSEAYYFLGFLATNSLYSFNGKLYTNTSLVTQAPYTPTRTAVQYVSWQANDPLVHYIASDLNYSGTTSGLTPGTTRHDNDTPPILPDLGRVNDRYQPWGVNSELSGFPNVDTNAYNTAYKDSLMWQSDNWDFPTNKFPTVGWLGRVHRGTPWQTAYLKAANIVGANDTWWRWTGDANTYDAANSAPVTDRLLFDLFTTAPNDNATRGQLPINVGAGSRDPGAGLAAWSALFSGMVALTNMTTAPAAPSQFVFITNNWVVIDPAGVNGLDSPLGLIVTNINRTRAAFSSGAFKHVGDILAVPQLTEQSPFLNWNNPAQQKSGISDELYEWLPQQAMSLMRLSSAPRYVIYCYGQTLKPAPNSVLTSGGTPFFGMATNYQIVSEIATRALLHIEGAPTNTHAVIESFNPLPPD